VLRGQPEQATVGEATTGEEENGGSSGNSSVWLHTAVRGGEVVSSGDRGRHNARPATHLGRSKACRRGWRGAPTVNGQHGLPALAASMRARLLTGVVARSNRRPDTLTHGRAPVAFDSAPHGGGARPGCQMRRGADERARVRRGTTHRWASRGSFYHELKLFRNKNWSGKIARNGKKSRKNCGGRKSNLEHLSMLQLFPNLHKF
jgi:hypothetical protein